MPSWRNLVCAAVALAAAAGCDAEGDARGAEAWPAAAAESAPLDSAVAAALPAGATREVAEEGRRLFATCAVCHGFDAEGTQLGPSLRDAEWTLISGELAEIERVIRDGVPEPGAFPVPMPALGGGDFTAGELRAVAVYVYALGHAAP